MSDTPNLPVKPRKSGVRRALLVIWLAALAAVVMLAWSASLTRRIPGVQSAVAFIAFLGWLVLVVISLYWIAVAIRWLMRKLFWRVGRRLFLSYILIGVMPFFLMATLFLAIGYMIAGVMSGAALRGQRQATLGQMESWALEYGLTGRKPKDGLPTLEIYDDSDSRMATLPQWLKTTTFSGATIRDGMPLLVASRQFPATPTAAGKTVVFAQPLDEHWSRDLQEKGGMIARPAIGRDVQPGREQRGGIHINTNGRSTDLEAPSDFDDLFARYILRRVIWADVTTVNDWKTGRSSDENQQIVTLIVVPVTNVFQYYLGEWSSTYLPTLVKVTITLTVMLFVIYMIATLFAAMLIFSISRAVNRIDKGTKAVERGDFTYRIRMKPHNQLGEMAQSFDRMTESIASLLITVAEKERLQSEIEIAATIQRNLLPKEGPQFRGVSFAAHFEPTTSIGGDYYDVFNLDKSRLAVAIGDVSGHGLSTGLVMAMVKAAITTLVEEGADETSLFHRLNDLVFRSTERRAFMTLAFTIYDLEHNTIRHTNAGHLYPYLLRNGQPPRSIESPSLPLGVRSTINTSTVELDLQEGDAIVYLSDGIVEAQNEEGDPLGFETLESLLGTETQRYPNEIRDHILNAVALHSGNRPADDDRTVMVLRFDNFKPRAAQAVVDVPVETVARVEASTT
jgi:serine phosphatase RsbU (regulator of sigma subunit)